MSLDRTQIKKELINRCRQRLQEEMSLIQKTMDEAQDDANAHKGAMESRYDTFKEEAQAKKDAYSRQVVEVNKLISLLMTIDPSRGLSQVSVGAIVETEKEVFFISANIFNEPIVVGETLYTLISLNSPIGQKMRGKKAGDVIPRTDGDTEILAVY